MSKDRIQYLRKLDIQSEIIGRRIIDIVGLSRDFGDDSVLEKFLVMQKDLLIFRSNLNERMSVQ